jgi:hypothetical protein
MSLTFDFSVWKLVVFLIVFGVSTVMYIRIPKYLPSEELKTIGIMTLCDGLLFFLLFFVL